ncbi:TraR/DksA family transcriptional regulator [Janibacter melonis]|uniref:TraR/DksA family transcriptional regulator n=1 Tax=Janibacter melonis TaxID=262209 RepID=UPI00174AF9B3|nr:TraR/DksA C4-type zinc finger protein [Janibacter melonis]
MARSSTTAAAKTPATKKTAKKSAAKKSAEESAATTTSTRTRSKAGDVAPTLVVRDDEAAWTKTELKAVRKEIDDEVARLRTEIETAEHDLVDLMRDHADGSGDDQADAGAKTFEREQEVTLANNTRAMLIQNLHALERIDDGTYGRCESCGNAIGKLRLQAYPRATLCVTCKTKQERR